MSVPLVGPDGQEYVLDNDDPAALEGLRSQGFRTPDEHPEGPVGAAIDIYKTGLQGATRGLTGGLSDVAAKALGEATGEHGLETGAQESARLVEQNPVTATVSELGGMLASPLNKAGDLVTKGIGATTVAGRIGANVAGGMAVGSLFGAGKTMSDAALGDVDLTAEKLLAGAGLGALLGGAGGGIGSAIGEAAGAVLPKARTLAMRAQSALDDVANDAAIGATRAQQGVINRIGDDKLKAVAEALRSRGHLELTPEKMAQSVAKDREALGKTLGKFLDDAETAGKTPSFSGLLKRLDDFEAGINPLEREAIAGDLSAARKAVQELGARPAGAVGKQGSGFRALDDLKQTIQAKAKFSKGPVPLDDVTFGLKRQVAGIFRDELDQQLLPQIGSDAAKAFTESKSLYGALKDAERLAESGAGRVGGVGLRDMLTGVMGATVHPLGAAAALGSKLMRENGPAIVARIANRLSREPALTAVAKSFAAALPQTAPKMGPYGPLLAQAAQRGPAVALATHMAYSQVDPSYSATAQLAGLTHEAPDEHGAVLGRAQAIAEAQAAAAAHDNAIRDAIDNIASGKRPAASSPVLKSQDFGAKRMRQDSVEGHRRRVEEVRLLATDPQALIDRVTANMGGLGGVAPGVAASMTATAQRAVTYLAQQAEVPPKPGPLAREWVPNDAERHSFALKLEAVQEPMSILSRAAQGRLVKSQVDAVRAVYPALARDIENQALERMVSGERMPYRARLMLSMLTGIDADGSTSQRAIAANQTAIANAGQKPSETMEPKGSAAELSIARRTATPASKREIGRED